MIVALVVLILLVALSIKFIQPDPRFTQLLYILCCVLTFAVIVLIILHFLPYESWHSLP